MSIVRSAEIRNYRRVAQLHWGLTDEQMLGMHVHHHPPVSEGGRNIPEHLYVCSSSIHSNGWHNGEYFIEQATEAGTKYGSIGGTIGGKCPWWTNNEVDVRAWECPGEEWRRGRSQNDWGKRPYWTNGRENRRSWECPGEGWVKGLLEKWWTDGTTDSKTGECPGEGWWPGRSNLSTNSQKWMCTATGFVSTAGPLSKYQNARGINTSFRVKLHQ